MSSIGRNHIAHPDQLKRLALRREVYRLRTEGKTHRQIADALGIKAHAVSLCIEEESRLYLEECAERVATVRQMEVDRLDELFAVQMQIARDGDIEATKNCLRIMERRSKLLGLDCPVKVEQTHTSFNILVPGAERQGGYTKKKPVKVDCSQGPDEDWQDAQYRGGDRDGMDITVEPLSDGMPPEIKDEFDDAWAMGAKGAVKAGTPGQVTNVEFDV
jgi:transcriptional regulator